MEWEYLGVTWQKKVASNDWGAAGRAVCVSLCPSLCVSVCPCVSERVSVCLWASNVFYQQNKIHRLLLDSCSVA